MSALFWLTRSLREPGGPCIKSMEVSESCMEWVEAFTSYIFKYTFFIKYSYCLLINKQLFLSTGTLYTNLLAYLVWQVWGRAGLQLELHLRELPASDWDAFVIGPCSLRGMVCWLRCDRHCTITISLTKKFDSTNVHFARYFALFPACKQLHLSGLLIKLSGSPCEICVRGYLNTSARPRSSVCCSVYSCPQIPTSDTSSIVHSKGIWSSCPGSSFWGIFCQLDQWMTGDSRCGFFDFVFRLW